MYCTEIIILYTKEWSVPWTGSNVSEQVQLRAGHKARKEK